MHKKKKKKYLKRMKRDCCIFLDALLGKGGGLSQGNQSRGSKACWPVSPVEMFGSVCQRRALHRNKSLLSGSATSGLSRESTAGIHLLCLGNCKGVGWDRGSVAGEKGG